jgi:hypothetical protein
LNEAAAGRADEQVYTAHAGDPRPNALYDGSGARRPLSATDPSQAALRSEWMDAYVANGGEVEDSDDHTPTPPDGPVLPCAKQLLNARWSPTTVKCGSVAQMLSDTRNIAAGAPATHTVKKIDNTVLATVNVAAGAGSITGDWTSQKPNDAWGGPEIKFTVGADGLTADSQDPQLSFHRYANIARTPLSQDISANGFLIKKRVLAELADRVLILHVPIKLRKCGTLPARRKNEAWGTWASRWTPGAYRAGHDDVSANDKTNLKNGIEAHFRRKKALHRTACARHAGGCPDPVSRKCCKFEIQVLVHFYDLNDATAPAISSTVNYWNDTERANAANWFATDYPGSIWVFAHEVGHLLGFYDEYTGGATDSTPGTVWQNAAAFTIANLMNGASPQRLENYYFGTFATWIGGPTGEAWATQNHV